MELGLFSFVETRVDPATGRQLDAQQRIHDLLGEIELADQVGLDVYGIGEHHRPDYVSSSPATLLAAAAARTSKIRLTSAVSVLSSDDPVRVFQQYSTVDLISGGRAEIMAGRGSFIESFPLFGQDLDDYAELFSEKFELLLKLRESERVTWQGRHRPSIDDRGVWPRPAQDRIPIWRAVGGSPQSVVAAATAGVPISIAIIGGQPHRFQPIAELYRESARRAGHDPATLPIGISSHGFLADTEAEAKATAFGPFAQTMSRIGRERGWPPYSQAQFEAETRLDGALILGSPDQVIEKILHQHEIFGHDRVMIQLTVGPIEHAKVLRAIELYGTKVAPVVRREIAGTGAAAG